MGRPPGGAADAASAGRASPQGATDGRSFGCPGSPWSAGSRHQARADLRRRSPDGRLRPPRPLFMMRWCPTGPGHWSENNVLRLLSRPPVLATPSSPSLPADARGDVPPPGDRARRRRWPPRSRETVPSVSRRSTLSLSGECERGEAPSPRSSRQRPGFRPQPAVGSQSCWKQ
jgi:hypothetical protein